MSDYLRKDEALLEDLLNRILDTPEDNSNIGLYMIKQQANRIVAYRAQKEDEEKARKASPTTQLGNVVVKTPAGATA